VYEESVRPFGEDESEQRIMSGGRSGDTTSEGHDGDGKWISEGRGGDGKWMRVNEINT